MKIYRFVGSFVEAAKNAVSDRVRRDRDDFLAAGDSDSKRIPVTIAKGIASVVMPAEVALSIVAAGLAKGVHKMATAPVQLDEAAKENANKLCEYLDAGDYVNAKKTVVSLFTESPHVTRKDLAHYLGALEGSTAKHLSTILSTERAEQGYAKTWINRLPSIGPDAQVRIEHLHALIDQVEEISKNPEPYIPSRKEETEGMLASAVAASSTMAAPLLEKVDQIGNAFAENPGNTLSELTKAGLVPLRIQLGFKAVGVAAGVHQSLTEASPLQDSAKKHGLVLIDNLEKRKFEDAKKAVSDLFKDLSKPKRKDLAAFLQGYSESSAWAADLAERIDHERANQTHVQVWQGRIFGETPESRSASVIKHIDAMMRDDSIDDTEF